MIQKEDVVKFAVSGGKVVSGRAKDVQVKGLTQTGLTVLEILLLRNKIHETFTVLEDNVEIIAYGNR